MILADFTFFSNLTSVAAGLLGKFGFLLKIVLFMDLMLNELRLEVCTGPELARELYPTRQMRGDFFNRPDRAGPAHEGGFFQWSGPVHER